MEEEGESKGDISTYSAIVEGRRLEIQVQIKWTWRGTRRKEYVKE